MKSIIVDQSKLNPKNLGLFKALTTYWQEKGWCQSPHFEFNVSSIVEVQNELVESEKNNQIEQIDILISTLSVLENSDGERSKTVSVSNDSFIGAKNFRFITKVDDDSSPVSIAVVSMLESCSGEPKQTLELLYQISKLKGPLQLINIDLQLIPALSQKEILKIDKAFPLLDSSNSGATSTYTLTYKVLLENGKSHLIKNSEFVADRGYLMKGQRYILFDNDMYEAISKQRSLTNMDRTEVSALLNNPTQALFPAGRLIIRFSFLAARPLHNDGPGHVLIVDG